MHHSHHLELYERLREKLDKAPVGLPKTVSGVEREILSVLFDEEEAKIALHMPFVRFTAEMLAEKTGKTYYRLFPVIVGFSEMPFLPGLGKDPRQEKLAPLWYKYRKEGFLDEIGNREHAILRALPEKDTISRQSVILPYEDAERLVR